MSLSAVAVGNQAFDQRRSRPRLRVDQGKCGWRQRDLHAYRLGVFRFGRSAARKLGHGLCHENMLSELRSNDRSEITSVSSCGWSRFLTEAPVRKRRGFCASSFLENFGVDLNLITNSVSAVGDLHADRNDGAVATLFKPDYLADDAADPIADALTDLKLSGKLRRLLCISCFLAVELGAVGGKDGGGVDHWSAFLTGQQRHSLLMTFIYTLKIWSARGIFVCSEIIFNRWMARRVA